MARTSQAQVNAAMAERFKMLGDSTRIGILVHLAKKGPTNVGRICEQLSIAQPTASHHLGLLKRSGILIDVRDGKNVNYQLNNETCEMRDGKVTIDNMLAINI